MKKEDLKELIRESCSDLVFEGKKTFGQLAVGSTFKLPNDDDDATLEKISKTHYMVKSGPQGKGIKYNMKSGAQVIVGESIYVMGQLMMENMSETIASTINEAIQPWIHKEAVDKEAATELELYITNDGTLYRQQITSIIKNLAKKKDRGVYDAAKAVKLWMYAVENGAKKYATEFDVKANWHKIFDKPTREAVAKELSAFYEEEVDDARKPIKEAKSATKTSFECMECGKKFSKTLKSAGQDVKCPKCGGYDVDID